MSETGYQRMKRLVSEARERSERELKNLAENYHNDPDYIAKEGFNKGVFAAIKEIEGWESLLIKAHDTAPYANPKEAAREHKNTMNLLGTIKSKLEGKIL